jgi:uncharacterized membrane protein (DUF373 family)
VKMPGTKRLARLERAIFALTGWLLYLTALILIIRTAVVFVAAIVAAPGNTVTAAQDLLNGILSVLILIELAYTVVLSIRGHVLTAEPFLIIGIIAIVRRILVIAVGEPTKGAPASSYLDFATLGAVTLMFVISLVLLRRVRVRVPKLDDLETPSSNGP